MRAPSYDGHGLVNLVAELERRLTGSSPVAPLHPELGRHLPAADSYLLVLVDGLGDHQLDHPAAATLARDRVAALDAPFPTTTPVAMASIATGRPPAQHGLLGYEMWLPEAAQIVNTIWWVDHHGTPVAMDHAAFLPAPNLAERLQAARCRAVVVQPAVLSASPLNEVLHRGAMVIPAADDGAAVEGALEEAAVAGSLVVLYLPYLDYAAHATGQTSREYAAVVRLVSSLWDELRGRLPPGASLLGTADHGHVDVAPERRHAFRAPAGLTLYGDARAIFARGDPDLASRLATGLPARWVDAAGMEGWWGPGPPHPELERRAPDGVFLADDGCALFPAGDPGTVGHHGGLSEAELRIPLLVGG